MQTQHLTELVNYTYLVVSFCKFFLHALGYTLVTFSATQVFRILLLLLLLDVSGATRSSLFCIVGHIQNMRSASYSSLSGSSTSS